eukprot:5726869-Pleurochrysis_carterae.AAC.1
MERARRRGGWSDAAADRTPRRRARRGARSRGGVAGRRAYRINLVWALRRRHAATRGLRQRHRPRRRAAASAERAAGDARHRARGAADLLLVAAPARQGALHATRQRRGDGRRQSRRQSRRQDGGRVRACAPAEAAALDWQ